VRSLLLVPQSFWCCCGLRLILCSPSVICQGFVPGLVGKRALLPCYSDSAADNVFWRDKDNNNLLDINKDTPNPKLQHQKYKVTSFPGEYKNGNFSIKISKLRLDDADFYECNIPKQHFVVSVQLKVTGWFIFIEVSRFVLILCHMLKYSC
uniref:Ig-like domain-containing protein n=1 Tax=Xiphophorus maculatus TaxID=8083 RepID=A0A3B5RB59_XIPMA